MRAIAGLLLVFAPAAAFAQSQGPACWARSIDMADRTTSPLEGGDNTFFTRVGGSPPLGFMVFANSPEMMRFPGLRVQDIPLAERGCGMSTFLNSRTWKSPNPLYAYSATTSSATSCTTTIPAPSQSGRTFDPRFTYPRTDNGCYLGSSYKTVDDIDPAKFYTHLQWTDTSFGIGRDAATACNNLFNGVEKSDCTACLTKSDTPGYYISPSQPDKSVFSGNFLHFFTPTYVGALAAWKNTISGNAKIIWGHAIYDNALPGPAKGKDPNPACNKFSTDFSTSNRGSYINDFSNSPPPFSTITKFPLAESIFSIGYFLTDSGRFANPSTYVRTTDWSPRIGLNQDTICAPCQYSALIVITDGSVSYDTTVHPTITGMNVATPVDTLNAGGICTSDANCGEDFYCNLGFCSAKAGRSCTGKAGTSECGPAGQCTNIVSGVGTCSSAWYADDAAAYFAQNDVRTQSCYTYACEPEKQYMATYIINVGKRGNQALKNVANVGTGLYLEAATASEISDALQDIVNDILKRSTSYAVASVTSVQTRTTTAVFVPRFKPSVLTNWEGHLYRYKLFNENAAGCTSADTKPLPPATQLNADQLSRNPNGDASCGDVYMLDADNNFIGENSDGDFMRLDRTKPYPWPVTSTPARPLWDAANVLQTSGPAARNLLTAVDRNGNGTIDNGEQIAFTAANVNLLQDGLGVGPPNGAFCSGLGTMLSQTFATETDCATMLIRWVRGEDIRDEDGDGNTAEARPIMLADIFHSSPYLMTPPLNTFFCDNDFSTQCVPTLYQSKVPNAQNAYASYLQAYGQRNRVVLVGSNDGMLHAFHAGTYRTGDDPETSTVEPAGNVYFDSGTGQELWGFIPPEALPKLKRLLTSDVHAELVDGSPMVRDVWVDMNQDGQKQATEFRTVAVTGMRRGGRSYFALDVTDPANPNFLWNAPRFGTADSLDAGQSWSDFAPLAPAIVPVLAKNASPYAPSFNYGTTAAREQWVVMLGGGYDPAGIRGRSLNAYDIWTGKQVWRFAQRDSTSATDVRFPLAPVTAAVGMIDWFDPNAGSSDVTARVDGYFDTGFAGDLLGNLWTIRMQNPGEDTDGDGLYDNWFASRAFESGKGQAISQKLPVFEMVNAARFFDQGVVRVYFGTGDRAAVRDQQGGLCALNNLPACIRKGCNVDVRMNKQNIGNSPAPWSSSGELTATASSGASQFSPSNYSATATGSAPPSCNVPLEVAYSTSISCSSVSTPPSPSSGNYTYGVTCSDGDVTCGSTTPRPALAAANFDFAGPTTTNRFFSVNPFAKSGQALFNTLTGATSYDQARLTEADLAVPGNAATGGTFATLVTPPLNTGYQVTYAAQNERSTDIPVLANGYAFWQTFTPGAITNATNPCARQAADLGNFYHADMVTGGASVDTGTNVNTSNALVARYSSKNVLTPPKTVIPQKVITPQGQVVSTLLSIEPGAAPLSVETGRTDLYTPIQVLEVDRKTHDCRHAGNCN